MSKAKSGGDAQPRSIRISTGTVVKTVLIIIAVLLLYFIRDIVVIFILALLLAALIGPFADWMAKYRIRRGIAVLIVYLGILALLAALVLFIIPPLQEQVLQIAERYGPLIDQIAGRSEVLGAILNGELFTLQWRELFEAIRNAHIADSLPQIAAFITTAFGFVIGVFTVFALAFYIVVEEERLLQGIRLAVPEKYRGFTDEILPKVKQKTGQWLRGQLLIMFVIFFLMYVILEFVLNLPFALVLAALAGLLEVVPFLGPILSSVPGIIIAFAVSPTHALLTVIAYFLVQQFEGQVLTPKVMQSTAGINPVYSILAVLVGYQLVGPLGAILAIPVTVIGGLIYMEWLAYQGKIPKGYER